MGVVSQNETDAPETPGSDASSSLPQEPGIEKTQHREHPLQEREDSKCSCVQVGVGTQAGADARRLE